MSRIAAVVVCAIVIVLNVACSLEPSDERPGFGLSGEVNQQAVEDWSFTSDAHDVSIETTTSYFIPHSVTVWVVTLGNQLYVSADEPDGKSWVANVARDPNVRLKFGDKIYEQKLVVVTDAETMAKIDTAFAKKYDYEEEEFEDVEAAYWRVVERD